MSANQLSASHRFEAQTMAQLFELWWGLLSLYRVFDESGIAAMVEMDPGDLVRLAAPGVFGPDPDIELSGVLAGMVEETGASESLFGYLLGLGAMGICKGQAERAGA